MPTFHFHERISCGTYAQFHSPLPSHSVCVFAGRICPWALCGIRWFTPTRIRRCGSEASLISSWRESCAPSTSSISSSGREVSTHLHTAHFSVSQLHQTSFHLAIAIMTLQACWTELTVTVGRNPGIKSASGYSSYRVWILHITSA